MLAACLVGAAELALEVTGALLSLRRRNWILFSLFAFCVISDISGYILLALCGQNVLALAYWIQRAGKSILLSILACSILGRMVREHNAAFTELFAGLSTLGAGAVVALVYSDAKYLPAKLTDAAMAMNIWLLVILILGYFARRGFLDAEWRTITAGFLLLVGSDMLVTLLWTYWPWARHLYPLGVIPAYGMWCWALRKTEVEKMMEYWKWICHRCGVEHGDISAQTIVAQCQCSLPKETVKEPELAISDLDEQFLKEMRITV